MNKKLLITIIISVVIAVCVACASYHIGGKRGYLTGHHAGYETGYKEGYDEGEKTAKTMFDVTPETAVKNPLQDMPSVNPFEEAINPFKDSYQNPFSQ